MSLLRRCVVLAALAVVGLSDSLARGQERDISPAVVRVLTKQRLINPARPWAPSPAQQNFGSGVVIAGGRILTNWHLAMKAVELEVQPFQGGSTFPARVVGIAPDFDLAVLEVRDPSFSKDRPTVALAAGLPRIGQQVRMYGYPVGGHALRTTDGTVSRIEHVAYQFESDGLRIEIEAAISPGNSGGPAMIGGAMAGLVYGSSPEGQNIGYLIPATEVRDALEDLSDGTYDGKLRFWTHCLALESDALRAKLGLAADVKGVLCGSDHPTDRDFPLKKGDIITRIGEHRIDNEGLVLLDKENFQVAFTYFVPTLAQRKGDRHVVPLTVLRGGSEQTIDVPLVRQHDWLFRPQKDAPPSYFIWGPLVFAPATEDIADMMTASPYASLLLSQRGSPLMTRRSEFAAFPGEELVMITGALPHRTLKGYESPTGNVVQTVNGTKIRNMRHLVETLRDAGGKYLEIEFADRYAQPLVFDRREVLEAMDGILDENGIRRQFSDDLRAVWTAAQPPKSDP